MAKHKSVKVESFTDYLRKEANKRGVRIQGLPHTRDYYFNRYVRKQSGYINREMRGKSADEMTEKTTARVLQLARDMRKNKVNPSEITQSLDYLNKHRKVKSEVAQYIYKNDFMQDVLSGGPVISSRHFWAIVDVLKEYNIVYPGKVVKDYMEENGPISARDIRTRIDEVADKILKWNEPHEKSVDIIGDFDDGPEMSF